MFLIRLSLVNSDLVGANFSGFGDFSNPSVLLAAIGLVAFCIIRCGKYLFTEERSKKMLPSIATVVLTILSLLQSIPASEY